MRMKLIKNNKEVVIFYLLITVSAFILKFNNNIELERKNSIVYNDIFN